MDEKQSQQPRAPKRSRWQRFKQQSMPAWTWLFELQREVGMDSRTQKKWLKRMNSFNAPIRQEAQRAFHDLPIHARRLLIVGAYRYALEHFNNVATGALVLCVVSVSVASSMAGITGFAFSLIAGTILLVSAFSYARASREQELAKNLLDSAGDVRLVPFLLLRLRQTQINNIAPRQMIAGRNLRNALARLLPYVQESDTAEWTGIHWNVLLCYLRHPFLDVDMTLTVLRCVAQIGNEEALREMTKLASIGSFGVERFTVGQERAAWVANKQVIEQVAQECLPTLEARIARQRQAQTLLRASGATPSPMQDVLLRPAAAYGSETPLEQLLRPGSSE